MSAIRPPRTFETARLRLRPPRDGDISAIYAYASHPEVTRHVDWERLTDPAQVGDFLARTEAGWQRGDEFVWVIAGRDDDVVIGAISLRSGNHEASFGYVLHQAAWGKGLATEAATKVVDWAMATLPIARIRATCDVANVRSARVLEKLGLRCERVLERNAVRPNLSAEPRDSLLFSMERRSALSSGESR